jgi:transcriptional regulator NrdR family protein
MVTKRNGRTEPFDREKIIRAIKYTGASEEEAQEVAIEVERTSRPTMTTSEIDRMVLDRLKPRNLSSYYRWLQWKEGHKQT